MKQNVVSFSGGRTSAYMVHVIERMRREGTIDNVHYVFLDTGAEHPKTYEFIRNCVNHFGIDLICLRSKINPELGQPTSFEQISHKDMGWDLSTWGKMSEKYGNPSVGAGHCTRELKTNPFLKYCDERFGKDKHTNWLGIRIDEPRRLREKKNTRYLAEISQMDKQDIIGWWKQQPFDLEIPEHLGNCVFCVKKGVKKIALAARHEPELANEFQAALIADQVRHMPYQEKTKDAIYRGFMTIPQIAETFDDFSDDQILQSIRGASGACTESCEVFGCQVDMFEQNDD